jgi:hypothetical protein
MIEIFHQFIEIKLNMQMSIARIEGNEVQTLLQYTCCCFLMDRRAKYLQTM